MMRAAVLFLALISTTGLAAAQQAQSATAVGASNLLQILLALIAVLALMMGVAWLLKRTGLARNPASGPVKIVGGVSVSARERILVVEVADQWIVVGVSPGRINTLSTLPRQDLPANSGTTMTGMPPNFSAWLKDSFDRRNNGK